MLGSKPKPQHPYDAGCEAALAGASFWHNPYVVHNAEVKDGGAWFAGWCYGMQQAEKQSDLPVKNGL